MIIPTKSAAGRAAVSKLALDVAAGEKVVAKEKHRLKKTRSKLDRSNKKIELKVIKKAVEATKEYKAAVENGGAPPPRRRNRPAS